MQTRSFCFVSDLVEGLMSLMNSNYSFPVNLGNPSEYTMLELVNNISEVVGRELDISYSPLPIDDPQKRRPDISKAKELLNWNPTTSLKEGLKTSVSWFEKAI